MTGVTLASVVVTHRYAASPQRVFDAFLDVAIARRFLFATATGEMITADEARQFGLINRVAAPDRLQAETMSLAQTIAAKPRATVRTGKEAFYRQIEMPLAEAYDYASRVMTENMLDGEAEEGVCAFLEKRPAKWPQ